MPTPASVCLFHVRSLLRSQPIPLVKALTEAQQVFLVAHNFPAFENEVGLADYVSTGITGNDEGVFAHHRYGGR